MKVMRASIALSGRSLREVWAGGTGTVLPLGFLFGAVMLVPMTLDAETRTLAPFAPGLLWLFLALSALVTLERLFQADVEDGSLDQIRLGPLPLEWAAMIKVLSLWLVTAVPMLALLPVAGLMLGLDVLSALVSVPVYALGSLAFFMWGGVGAALAAGVRRGGLLITLIVLPLYAPTVIFGAAAVSGDPFARPALLFLAAATLMSVAVAPIAMAQALKVGSD